MGTVIKTLIISLLVGLTLADPCKHRSCELCILQKGLCKFGLTFGGEGICVEVNSGVVFQMSIRTRNRCIAHDAKTESSASTQSGPEHDAVGSMQSTTPNSLYAATTLIEMDTFTGETVHSTFSGSVSPQPVSDVDGLSILDSTTRFSRDAPPILLDVASITEETLYSTTAAHTSDSDPTVPSTDILDMFKSMGEGMVPLYLQSLDGQFSCPEKSFKESRWAKTYRNMCRGKILQKGLLKSGKTLELESYYQLNPTHNKKQLCDFLIFVRRNCL